MQPKILLICRSGRPAFLRQPPGSFRNSVSPGELTHTRKISDRDHDGGRRVPRLRRRRPDPRFLVNGAAILAEPGKAARIDKSDPRFWNRLYWNLGGGRFQ